MKSRRLCQRDLPGTTRIDHVFCCRGDFSITTASPHFSRETSRWGWLSLHLFSFLSSALSCKRTKLHKNNCYTIDHRHSLQNVNRLDNTRSGVLYDSSRPSFARSQPSQDAENEDSPCLTSMLLVSSLTTWACRGP